LVVSAILVTVVPAIVVTVVSAILVPAILVTVVSSVAVAVVPPPHVVAGRLENRQHENESEREATARSNRHARYLLLGSYPASVSRARTNPATQSDFRNSTRSAFCTAVRFSANSWS
jgi:ribose 1,5-bisphosphokinase PhnN